jgi:hypothetical protein
MQRTITKGKLAKPQSFDQMGSLEIMWKLTLRHTTFIVVCCLIFESLYILMR